jgi:hypothetical protein
MQHGRDHDNRSVHIRFHRHNNTPDDPESEPPHVAQGEGELPPAPTRRAQEHEMERRRKKAQ